MRVFIRAGGIESSLLIGNGIYNIVSTTSATGLTSVNNSAVNNTKIFRDGILLLSGSSRAFKDFTGTFNFQAKKQVAFLSIGFSLTDSETLIYYNIIQEYQTMLGRQI